MRCIFCTSTHKSTYCDKVKSEKAREKIAKKNKFCRFCFVTTKIEHLPGKDCPSNKRCIAWYSTEHHTVFCPKRFSGLQLFIPKIDDTLFSRFFQFIDLDEKYFMVFLSPKLQKMGFLKPAKCIDVMCKDFMYQYPESIIIAIQDLNLFGLRSTLNHRHEFFNFMDSKKIICFARNLLFRDLKITRNEFLVLLSPHTKHFNIDKSLITPDIEISECLRRIPNVEKISICKTNIQITETWLDDLLKLNAKNSFQRLYLEVPNHEMDTDKLIDFIETKCSPSVSLELILKINRMNCANVEEAKRNLMKNILKHFIKIDRNSFGTGAAPTLFIHLAEFNTFDHFTDFGAFILKDAVFTTD